MIWTDLGLDSGYVTLGSSLNISAPHFLYLQSGDDKACLRMVATIKCHDTC